MNHLGSRPDSSTWQSIAGVAAVFTLFLGGMMLVTELVAQSNGPLQSTSLKEAKNQLRTTPTSEHLKQRIRELDLDLRKRYFRHLSRMKAGGVLLLAGVAIFAFAGRRISSVPVPSPRLDRQAAERQRRAGNSARLSVAVTGVSLASMLLIIGLTLGNTSTKPSGTELANTPSLAAPIVNDVASPQELRDNWPRFRGSDGSGRATCTNPPVSWDAQTGAGVAWKVPIPAGGFNSPIVWKERVFLSGGDVKQREVFSFSSADGALSWRRTVDSGVAAAKTEVPESTGYTASTLATDGARVYALFANGDVAALSLEGDVAWTKNLGPFKNAYGHAASLVTWQDHLLVQIDQGESTDGKSRLLALEGRTGKLIWERPRQVGASWSTPIVISAAGKSQVITVSLPWAAAYDVRNGTALWRVDGLGGEVTSSPVFENGLVIAVSPSEKLLAIRPDGEGDVTKTHIAWTNEENVPDITSPVGDGELLFTLTTSGTLTCHDLKDGKVQWQHDFDMDFHASPAIAGKRMYLFSQKGTAIVVAAGRQFEELFRAEMGEEVHASPAFAGDKIFLRGASHLWCLARAAQTLARQQ